MILKLLDPRTKLINIFLVVIILFNVNTMFLFITLNLYCLLFIVTSEEKKIYKLILPFIPMFIVMLFLNSIFITTGEYLLSFLFIDVYLDAIKTTILFFDRLVMISMLTYVTVKSMTNSEVVDGFKYLFTPLKYIKFPYIEAALICSITLSFFPIVIEEVKRIRQAQIMRGINYNTNVIKKLINMKAIIIPTFIYCFTKAINIGNAIEIKGFNPKLGRSSYITHQFKLYDYVIFVMLITFIVL